MEDWQKDIMDAIENNRWQAEDLSDIAVPRAKAKSIPVSDMDFILDIVYFAARKMRGKKLTPEHEDLFNEYDNVLRNQGMRGFHDRNVETHAYHPDEDTMERDDKYYPNDRLHDNVKKSWTEVLKSPFPNHMLNRRARGGRRVRKGTGRGGLFRYGEIDEILEARVTPLIDARYEQEIEKKTRQSIREAKKRLKAQSKDLSDDMKDYITRKVRKVLLKQKENNLYATAYGDYAKSGLGFRSAGKWFAGGLSALGYNPEDEEQMSYVLKRVHGIARQYFTDWKSKKEKEQEESDEEGDELVKSWVNLLKKESWYDKQVREQIQAKREAFEKDKKASVKKHPFVKDYRFGRCQNDNGTGCIRNLQSPERRKFAGSDPQGKTCMYCEDDSYKWSDVPAEVYQRDDWKNADKATQRKILDKYVKRNPRYDIKDFEPFY